MPRSRIWLTALAVVLCLAFSGPSLVAQELGGQDFAPTPVVKVNDTFQAGDQSRPVVDVAADGSFVVVWERDALNIGARRFGPDAIPNGSEFQVNFDTANLQGQPDVCVTADGDFVVAWSRSFCCTTNDIVIRRNVGGVFAPEFGDDVGNTVTTGLRSEPAIACEDAGDFVVTWRGETVDDANAIAARRWVLGVPQDTEFRVNTYTADPSHPPEIASDANGDFVIVWGQDDFDSDPPPRRASLRGGTDAGVSMRRYQADGTALDGLQVQVDASAGYSYGLDVDRHPDGDFIVTWDDPGLLEPGASLKRYTSQGILVGEASLVASGDHTAISRPVGVFAGPDGQFLLSISGTDGDPLEHQRFEDPLTASGPSWFSQGLGSRSDNLDVAGRSDGGFVVVWREYESPNSGEIFAQTWIPALFADGFESGDAAEWDP